MAKKTTKPTSIPVAETPKEKVTPVVVNKPTAEIPTEETALEEEVKFTPSEESVYVAETIDDISNPINERIAQLEEMLTRRWSGWRVQKIKRELEDLKSQL